ncbi:MAG: glycosyltransferase family 2 protein [Anaerolineae bacterium]|nr:glycosyltransferase family 2 protein [Anaerolineae bacterium]
MIAQPSAIETVPGRCAPDMSVVLVCWNNNQYLEPCLGSLYESALKARFETLVVDNGSTDGSQAMLAEKFPQVQLIQNNENVGLSRASNQGIQSSRGRYILLLNNDTLVNGESLDAMVEFMDSHPDAGAVGGRLLNPDGSFQSGYASFSSLTQEFLIASNLGEHIWAGYPSHGHSDHIQVVDWLSSACLLLRRTALDQVGLLDEQYFVYGDETDLQYRLKHAGWKVYYLPHVTIIHYGGRSLNRWRRRMLVYRGKMLFYKKRYSQLNAFGLRMMFGVLTLAKTLAWGVSFVIPSRQGIAQQELRSNLDVLRLCWHLE